MPRQQWDGIEPMGEVFLLTFLFIGLVRFQLRLPEFEIRSSTALGALAGHLLRSGGESLLPRDEEPQDHEDNRK